MTNAFPTTNCWMIGAGPYCEVTDGYGVTDEADIGAGTSYATPNEGIGAARQHQCLHDTKVACLKALNECFYNEMGSYLTDFSTRHRRLTINRGGTAEVFHSGENDWPHFSFPLIGGPYTPPNGMRIVSSVKIGHPSYGFTIMSNPISPKRSTPGTTGNGLTPFLPHAYAKWKCFSKDLPLECRFDLCYCSRKRCAKCEDDGSFDRGGFGTTAGRVPVNPDPEKKFGAFRADPLQTTKSREGDVIPLAYGRVLMAGNILAVSNSTLVTAREVIDKGSSIVINEREVRVSDIVVGVCANEIVGVSRVWLNGRLVYSAEYNSEEVKNAALEETPIFAGRIPGFEIDIFNAASDTVPSYNPRRDGEVMVGFRDQTTIVLRNYASQGAAFFPEVLIEVIQAGRYSDENEAFLYVENVKDFDLYDGRYMALTEDNVILREGLPQASLPVGHSPSFVNAGYDDVAVYSTPTDPDNVYFASSVGDIVTQSKNTSTPDNDWMFAPTKTNFSAIYARNGGLNMSNVAAVYSGNELRLVEYGPQEQTEVIRILTLPGPIKGVFTAVSSSDATIDEVVRVFYLSADDKLIMRTYILSTGAIYGMEHLDVSSVRFSDKEIDPVYYGSGAGVSIVAMAEHDKTSSVVLVLSNNKVVLISRNVREVSGSVDVPSVPSNYKAWLGTSNKMRYVSNGELITIDLTTMVVAREPSTLAPVRHAYDGFKDRLILLDSDKKLSSVYYKRVLIDRPTITSIIRDVLARTVGVNLSYVEEADEVITGYKVIEDVAAVDVIFPLAQLIGADVTDDGVISVFKRSSASSAPVTISYEDAYGEDERLAVLISPDDQTYEKPSFAEIKYHDAGNRENVVVKRISRPDIERRSNGPTIVLDAPFVIYNDEALMFAENLLAQTYDVAADMRIVLGPKYAHLSPGMFVSLDGREYLINAVDNAFGYGPFVIDAKRLDSEVYRTAASLSEERVTTDTGEFISFSDNLGGGVGIINTNSPVPLEFFGESLVEETGCVLAYSRLNRSVAIPYYVDSSARSNVLTFDRAAIVGRLASPLPAVDNTLEVPYDIQVFYDSPPDQGLFLGDTNGALFYENRTLLIEKEIVRYTSVEWSLDGLTATFKNVLRGDRMTWVVSEHAANAQVILYDKFAVRPIPLKALNPSDEVSLIFSSNGRFVGKRLRPLTDVRPPPMTLRDDVGFAVFGANTSTFIMTERYWNAYPTIFEKDFVPDNDINTGARPGDSDGVFLFTPNQAQNSPSGARRFLYILSDVYEKERFFDALTAHNNKTSAQTAFDVTGGYFVAVLSMANNYATIASSALPDGYKLLPWVVGYRQMHWAAVVTAARPIPTSTGSVEPDSFGKDAFIPYGTFPTSDAYSLEIHGNLNSRTYYPFGGALPLTPSGYDTFYDGY